MGRAKENWLLEQERGYGSVDGTICARCVDNEYLKRWISNNACSNKCSFCNLGSEKNPAADFEDFIGVVMVGVSFDWNAPDNEGIAYESAEGGYQAELTNIYDILFDGSLVEDAGDGAASVNISEKEAVLTAIADVIGYDRAFVSRDYYVGTEEENYVWAWEEFRSFVINKRRYLFSIPEKSETEFKGYRHIDPADFLTEVGKIINDKVLDSIVTLISNETDIVRLRVGHEVYSLATELGAPPPQYATQSNRMSPAGIPMFYGAFDYATAFAETFDENHDQNKKISCGTFRANRDLRVLNLAELPPVPSIFDEDYHPLIRPFRFLHNFAFDIAKPIARDGREHIEYVPTQIITEFFRHIFQTLDGEKLDGIAYKSSKHKGGIAFVLFCENHQASEQDAEPEPQHLLRLVGVRHQ